MTQRQKVTRVPATARARPVQICLQVKRGRTERITVEVPADGQDLRALG